MIGITILDPETTTTPEVEDQKEATLDRTETGDTLMTETTTTNEEETVNSLEVDQTL